MTPAQRIEEIKRRLESHPSEETFDPAYMFRNPHADVTFLLDRIEKLERVERLSRNIVSQWNEFGPAHGFDETVEKRFERMAAQAGSGFSEAERMTRESYVLDALHSAYENGRQSEQKRILSLLRSEPAWQAHCETAHEGDARIPSEWADWIEKRIKEGG